LGSNERQESQRRKLKGREAEGQEKKEAGKETSVFAAKRNDHSGGLDQRRELRGQGRRRSEAFAEAGDSAPVASATLHHLRTMA
jgi:hypothetical protein